MSLTADTLTVWRKPWRKQAFRRARHLISDQSPRPCQPGLALPAPRPIGGAPPPGGAPTHPQAPRLARPAAPCGSLDKAAADTLCAPGAAATGGGE